MSIDVVRAWKDAEYRDVLEQEQLAMIPANPAGEIELSDQELDLINGGVEAGSRGRDGCGNTMLSVLFVIICAVTYLADC